MQYEILDSPDFGFIRVSFDGPGEKLTTESAAMVARDTQVSMTTNMPGGLLGAAKRKLLGGESLFQNTFTASGPGQRLLLAPAPEGDVRAHALARGEHLFLSSGNWLASGAGVTLDTKWGGARGFFSGTGFFLLRCEGEGPVFFSSYGAIHEVEVGPQGFICDTSHVVGFTGGLTYSVRKVGGIKSLFLSGEGLVCEFRGQGRLWISTRSADRLASFLHPFRRVERKSQ
jgi:uncharacterized protein (TIGR00266 family)